MITQKSRPNGGGSTDIFAGQEFTSGTGALSNSSQSTAYDRLIAALEHNGCRVTTKGHDKAEAQCPAHDDKKPSLGIKAIEGQVLICCQAGCSSENVVASLNLAMRDLYDDPKGATYQYTSASGQPGRVVYRSPEKSFRQFGDMTRTELYRLPRVVAAVKSGETVYLVEGEKDVHALESLSVVATTAPMGASSFGKVDVGPLKGAQVVAVVDRDASGQKWAQEVQRRLGGYAADLRFVEAKSGKDAADHVVAGFVVGDFTSADVATGAEGWDEPEPLEHRPQLPDFPTNCLPAVVARYVDELCRSYQVPSGLAGPVALGVLSAASAGRVRVQVRSDWTEPVCLWVVPTADPASKKSAVVAAFRAPLDAAEGRLRDLLGPKVIESQGEKKIREQYAAKAQRLAAENPSDNKNMVEAASAVRLADEVKVLAMPRLTVGASTPEALVSLLAEQGGRIAAISAEAGIFDELTGGRYSSSANLDPLLNAHAGDMIQVDRKSRGPERVEHPALTLIASIQPYALRQMLTKENFAGRGLLARVLWSLPPNLAGTRTWEVEPVSAAAQDGYTALVENLAYSMAMREETVTLRLSVEAYDMFGVFFTEVESALAPGGELAGGLIGFWMGKLLGATVRIAGVLHAAAGESALGSPIPGATMRDAIEIARYFCAHAVEALGSQEDTRNTAARTLCEWLVKEGKATFTVREIQRNGPRPLRKKGAEQIAATLTHLAGLGYVRPGDGKGWELHPDAAKYLTLATAATAATAATPSLGGRESAGQGAALTVASSGDTWRQVATRGDTFSDDGPCRQLSPTVANSGDTSDSAVTWENGEPVATVATVARVAAVAGVAGVARVPEPRRPMTVVEPNPFDFGDLNCRQCGFPVGSVGCEENCRP